jgi:hypothetical protein
MEITYTKPDFEFETLKTKSVNGDRHYVTRENELYISITTMLGHFQKKSIYEWRQRVGSEEADRISKESSSNGTRMHSATELYLDGKDYSKYVKTEDEKNQFDILKTHLDNYLQETWYQEETLYSHRLGVAGRVDCIGLYNGKPTIIDFKTSRKFKKREWIKHYFMQTTFYAMAFYEMTGYPIHDIAILISVDKGKELQVYTDKVKNWMNPLWHKVQEYNAIPIEG